MKTIDELIQEKNALENTLENAEFPSPKDLRRIDELRSLILTHGQRDDLRISVSKPQDSFFVKRSMAKVSNNRKK